MARGRTERIAIVGATEDGNSAVLVAVASDGELLDRRHMDLTDSEFPTPRHHHEEERPRFPDTEKFHSEAASKASGLTALR